MMASFLADVFVVMQAYGEDINNGAAANFWANLSGAKF
jgi:hypothetical protein